MEYVIAVVGLVAYLAKSAKDDVRAKERYQRSVIKERILRHLRHAREYKQAKRSI